MSDPMLRLERLARMQDDMTRQQRTEIDFKRRKDDIEIIKRRKREGKQARKAG